jgi:hypothetical protein
MPATTMTQEALEKTYGIFPEAWYDLIARIAPGAFSSVVTWRRFQRPSGILEGIVGLILFYLIGFFLEVFAEGIIQSFWPQLLQEDARPLAGKPTQDHRSNEPSRLADRIRTSIKNQGPKLRSFIKNQGAKRIYEDVEFWNIRNNLRPSQWQAISKMSAESDLFKSLAGFFMIQIIFFGLSAFSHWFPGFKDVFGSMRHLSSLRILPWEISVVMAVTCVRYTKKLHKSTLLRLESYIVLNKKRLQSLKRITNDD